MIKKAVILFSIFSLLLFFSVSGQTVKSRKALDYFATGQYFASIDLLRDAYGSEPDANIKLEITFKIAECYRLTAQPEKAESWYKRVVQKKYNNPLIYLYYADALKMNSKFELAIENYNEYKKFVPNDPRGDNGVKSCELAIKWKENPNGYKVANMKFFNSKESEYYPAYANADYSEVYFTSSREESTGKEKHGGTGQNFSDIYTSVQDKQGKWSTPVPLGENINTEFEEGGASLSKDYNTIFFSRCEKVKKETMGCKIFVSVRKGDEWGKAEPWEITADSITVSHPTLSEDELSLYFVSDMAGGMGGKDIWKVTRDNPSGDWGTPINMGGDINTPGNEMFPFIHNDGTLYFSSDYHLGMGGLDIFRATYKNNKWDVENMRYPINSTYDDFAIAIEKDHERGFFSTSRDGNDEIYSFVLPPLKFNVEGIVRNEKTDQPLATATVKLVGSDGMTLSSETSADGKFKFMLRPNTDYVFVASKRGFLTGKGKETTKGLIDSKEFKAEIKLSSIAEPIELPNIFYDFAKWDLRPESMVALDKLVETLNDNPNVTIELRSHTDARGSIEVNIDLSQKRAQSVVDYLIEKGIEPARLRAKGYAATMPKIVDMKMAAQHPFLKEGTEITQSFIDSLPTEEEKEVAYQINRRTEFQVLSTDYKTTK
jgi:peptidoglycan-associated lipoprotein